MSTPHDKRNPVLRFLDRNKDRLTLVISGIVGIASIITSVVSCYVMIQQNAIYEKQTEILKSQNQPTFEINIYQQGDTTDGMCDTEILEVRNIGARMRSCNTSTTVFFALSCQHAAKQDAIIAEVRDYFMNQEPNSNDYGVVEKCWYPKNYLFFCKGRDAAMQDSHDGISYTYNRIFLTKIEYKDILGEDHVVYFVNKNEVNEENYRYYFLASLEVFGERFFSLNDINYQELKTVLDKRVATKGKLQKNRIL